MKQAAPLTAVIVEDNHASRTLLRGLLRNQGITVKDEATRGSLALESVRRAQPDLVCLDIMLPDTDGVTLLQQIKAEFPQTRVIMVTGSAEAERVKAALTSGADAFIVKPFAASTLVATLARLFGDRLAAQ